MSIILLQPDGVPITAQAERQGSAAIYGGGAGRPLGGRSGFRVDTAADVFTATASAWTLKPCSGMIDPGINTGMYGWANTSNLTQASIPGSPVAQDATLPRKDIYYVQVNDSTAGDGSGAVNADVKYLAGTPNANPQAPALPVRSFLIATVTVPQVGGGSPTVVVNPARFAAAGAPLPVYSEGERDALDKYDGLIVQRRDLPGRPQQSYDGSTWTTHQPPKLIANGAIAGDGTNLATKIQSGAVLPIVQAGSSVVATDVNGYFSVFFPQVFPNGLITVVPVNGDNATTGRGFEISLGTAAPTQGAFHGNVSKGDTPYANQLVRVNWIAYGW